MSKLTAMIAKLLLFILLSGTFVCRGICQSAPNPHGVVLQNDTCKLIDHYLHKLVAEKNFAGGVLIIKDRQTIFSRGYGLADKEKNIPFTPTTLASMGSITKAFTAAAIMKLVEQKKLSVNDQLSKFFPGIPADKAGITIHQLLTHSSGFHEFLQGDAGDYEKIDKASFLQRAFAEPLAFKPGERSHYTNVGMSILGIIIEQVAQVDYESFLTTAFFSTNNIKIGYHYPVSTNDTIAVGYQNGKRWGTHQERFREAGSGPYWNLKANGGLEASLNDMARWINGITNDDLLSRTSVEQMFKPQIREDGSDGKIFFGYGCNISQSRRNTVMIGNGGSNGIYFARLIRLPEEGLVFYMVTNESSINANMVLPNITQLYFQGRIVEDAVMMQAKFNHPVAKKIYDILISSPSTDLEKELSTQHIQVDDDMILLEVGQQLTQENKDDKALRLYQFYTKSFPIIVVAWNDLGDIYLRQNNKPEAINCYKQALKIRPANQRAKEALDKFQQ